MTVSTTASAADVGPLPSTQEDVLYMLAICGPLDLDRLRDYTGVRGRALAGALTALRLRGLAWRGASGQWWPTTLGYERGRP